MQTRKRICLISMPFTPVNTPGLGVSLLKSAITQMGAECDVYYAALDFLRFVCCDESPATALNDYNFIATNQQLGDVLFSNQLSESENVDVALLLRIIGIQYLSRSISSAGEQAAMFGRIWKYTQRISLFLEECFKARDWDSYDLLGFSSTFSQNIATLAFAKELKRKHPKLHIVCGGANCDGEMGRQMMTSFPFIDAIVQGEAEESFPGYAQRFFDGADRTAVPGALIRTEYGVEGKHPPLPVDNLDRSPIPDFDDYFAQLPPPLVEAKRRGEISLPIETSRGCWWGAVRHCIFCGLNPAAMTFREKSPSRALADFFGLRDRYSVTNFMAVDNIISLKYFQTVLPKLEGQGFHIFYETKANLSEGQVGAMARAGVRSIQPGIEGFSTEILKLMRKGVQGYQNLELLKWCAIYNVEPTWFYLYRFPGETADPYLRDAKRMKRWAHLPPPRAPNPVLIDRYSPLFNQREDFGITNLRTTPYTRWSYPGLSNDEQMRICYHFEADLPQGAELVYEQALWQAALDWSRAYSAGAWLYQFQTNTNTLVLDTRYGELRAYFITGCAHKVYSALRTGRSEIALERELAQIESQVFEPGADDVELACIAGMMGAHLLHKEPGSYSLQGFLELLDQESLAEPIDQRWLALAVDCTNEQVARKFGMQKFSRILTLPASSPIQPTEHTHQELVQLLQTTLSSS